MSAAIGNTGIYFADTSTGRLVSTIFFFSGIKQKNGNRACNQR